MVPRDETWGVGRKRGSWKVVDGAIKIIRSVRGLFEGFMVSIGAEPEGAHLPTHILWALHLSVVVVRVDILSMLPTN